MSLNVREEGKRIARKMEDYLIFIEDLTEDFFDSPEAIYFHGSRARNDNREDSDWDFCVVGPSYDELERLRIEIAEAGDLPKRFELFDVGHVAEGVDIMFASKKPKDGIVVWEG